MTDHLSGSSGADAFDFSLGSWNILNRRRTKDGGWEESKATQTVAKHLDGRVLLEHYEGELPGGETMKGLGIFAFDAEANLWSCAWLSNREAPDFRPLVGRFTNGIGEFHQVVEDSTGAPLHVRFIWDNITADQARWQQAFSRDGGTTWETNWVQDITRQ